MRLAAATAGALAAFALAAAPAQAAAAGVASDPAVAAQIVEHVNAARAAHGLAPLAPSPALTAAAAAHSQDMAERGYFDHDAPGGATFEERLTRAYGASAGENIAWGSPVLGAAEAVALWLSSPPHRENLLSPRWREIGVGAVTAASAPGEFGGQPVTIVTANFGARAATAAASPAAAVPAADQGAEDAKAESEPEGEGDAETSDAADGESGSGEQARPVRTHVPRFRAKVVRRSLHVVAVTTRGSRVAWATRRG